MQEIDSIGDFDIHTKMNLVAKREAPDNNNMFQGLLPASILGDLYLKVSFYLSLNCGVRKSVDLASSGLIRHSALEFMCSQQT